MNAIDLKGKVSIVTGACRGIGRACAEVLSDSGSRHVGICCRNSPHILAAAKEIGNKYANDVTGFVADLTNPIDVKQMIMSMAEKTGAIDILVINTGTPTPGSFSQCTIADWQAGINICLNSTLHLCNEVLPIMKANKFGRVIILTSIFAREPDSHFVVSSTLRSSLLSLTKCLADEFASAGITVNAICQGYVDTPLLREVAAKQATYSNRSIDSIFSDWKNGIPLKQFAEPEEIGHAVAFLASEVASYITGTAFTIDGGLVRSII